VHHEEIRPAIRSEPVNQIKIIQKAFEAGFEAAAEAQRRGPETVIPEDAELYIGDYLRAVKLGMAANSLDGNTQSKPRALRRALVALQDVRTELLYGDREKTLAVFENAIEILEGKSNEQPTTTKT